MNTEQLYQQRLDRYVTALRNEQPHRIPIRPFVAEFAGTYAGYTCQELALDYRLAFEAAVRCARDFDWDAVVPNMVASYWPTLKPCIEEFWKHGHQTRFYAEGKWKHHLDTFRELPERSLVFH